jgi:hypothetical protein
LSGSSNDSVDFSSDRSGQQRGVVLPLMTIRVESMGSADNPPGPSGDTGPDSESDEFDEVEEWGEESFPASDPPAGWSGPPES